MRAGPAPGKRSTALLRRRGLGRLHPQDRDPAGYSVVVWRGRHVAEPTELSEDEASAYRLELLRVGRALEAHFEPVKLNYDLLGNSLPHLHTQRQCRAHADDPKPGWPLPDDDPPLHPELDFRPDVAALRALLCK
ncbi:MAG TPA: hypothetical protein VFL61_01065 [Gaiellaceae bacterium]|nr:hypothetical protein [Gaiellaceae bacterium]